LKASKDLEVDATVGDVSKQLGTTTPNLNNIVAEIMICGS